MYDGEGGGSGRSGKAGDKRSVADSVAASVVGGASAAADFFLLEVLRREGRGVAVEPFEDDLEFRGGILKTKEKR